MLEFEAITERVIGAAIEVHKRLGPGFVESVYELALCVELRKRGVEHVRQVVVPVFYDDVEVGHHRLDLVVEREIVVELKAVRAFEEVHFAILRSYLRALRKRHGLLLNFEAPRLEIRRVLSDLPSLPSSFLPSLDVVSSQRTIAVASIEEIDS